MRLRMPKCKACKKSIRDGVRAVEALGGKWCWGCFVCEVSLELRLLFLTRTDAGIIGLQETIRGPILFLAGR